MRAIKDYQKKIDDEIKKGKKSYRLYPIFYLSIIYMIFYSIVFVFFYVLCNIFILSLWKKGNRALFVIQKPFVSGPFSNFLTLGIKSSLIFNFEAENAFPWMRNSLSSLFPTNRATVIRLFLENQTKLAILFPQSQNGLERSQIMGTLSIRKELYFIFRLTLTAPLTIIITVIFVSCFICSL